MQKQNCALAQKYVANKNPTIFIQLWCPNHEFVILNKCHNNWVKIVAYFWTRAQFRFRMLQFFNSLGAYWSSFNQAGYILVTYIFTWARSLCNQVIKPGYITWLYMMTNTRLLHILYIQVHKRWGIDWMIQNVSN